MLRRRVSIVCEVCDAATALAQDVDDLEAAAVDERIDGKHGYEEREGGRRRRGRNELLVQLSKLVWLNKGPGGSIID